MAKRIVVINQLRPRINSQGTVDAEKIASRISKNTTYNPAEIFSMLRLFVNEANTALQAGETVKIDGLLYITPNMKVGGEVNVSLHCDRGALAVLNNPQLWNTQKVQNHPNLHKTADQLVAQWNEEHPEDLVEE